MFWVKQIAVIYGKRTLSNLSVLCLNIIFKRYLGYILIIILMEVVQ